MPSIILKSSKCPKCQSRPNKMTLNDFKQKLSSINPNIEVLGSEYINRITPILVKCLKCNREWETKPLNLMKGYGCIKCNRKK
jgi:Zn finger protein HypA/HybF involved in hydrogenase expression